MVMSEDRKSRIIQVMSELLPITRTDFETSQRQYGKNNYDVGRKATDSGHGSVSWCLLNGEQLICECKFYISHE